MDRFKQFKTQLSLLKNSCFSVLLVDRKKSTKATAFNYNIQGRKSLAVEEIEAVFNTLKFYNQNKCCDIYIKAEQGDFYNVVIDDLTADKLENLLSVVNLDYVLFSSENNYQAVINLEKSAYTLEQANFITITLNKQFGDSNFSGANHYLRCAGFFNKKPSNNNEKACLFDFINVVGLNNGNYFANLLQGFHSKNLATENTVKESDEFIKVIDELSKEKAEIAKNEVKAEIALCRRKFKVLDWSAIDFRIVKRLYKKRFSESEIAIALVRFTDFQDRHSAVDDYLKRTIRNAINSIK